MSMRVTVTNDRGIALPEEATVRLRLAPGSTLLVEVRDDRLVLLPERDNYSERLRGLHREVWAGVDPDEYVRGERDAWTEPE